MIIYHFEDVLGPLVVLHTEEEHWVFLLIDGSTSLVELSEVRVIGLKFTRLSRDLLAEFTVLRSEVDHAVVWSGGFEKVLSE